MASRKEQLRDTQYLMGLEAAYVANKAVDDIRVNQEMIDSWQISEQLAVSGEERSKAEVEDWGKNKVLSEAQFSAFDAVVGALIGRHASKLERYPQLSGEGLPRIEEQTERDIFVDFFAKQ